MKHRSFGSCRQTVATVGQGTWNMELDDRRSAVPALRRGLDLGATHVDTAEMYGDGAAEEIVCEAIGGRRDEVFLVSKVLPTNATRRGTVAACERSLARLGTDRLDCYLLHWRGSVPLAETLAGFDDLLAAGKILSWGVSNFDVADLDELIMVSGGRVPACNQVLYHVRERAIEHAVLPWCQQHGVALVAYSPYGQGDFPTARSSGGAALARVAARRGASARQVALAFLMRDDGVFVIPKSSDPARVAENAGAADVVLTAEDIAELDAALPRGRARALPML